MSVVVPHLVMVSLTSFPENQHIYGSVSDELRRPNWSSVPKEDLKIGIPDGNESNGQTSLKYIYQRTGESVLPTTTGTIYSLQGLVTTCVR